MSEVPNGSASGTGRQEPVRETHRQYSLDLKRRIVEETFVPGASVSIVARQHNVNSNMVFTWRKRYREGTLGPSKPASKATRTSAQDLIRIGVIDPGSGLRPLPVVGGSSAPSPTAPPRLKEPAVLEKDGTTVAGIIEIELPNRVKLRVPASIGAAALRRVLAVAGQSV
jgi:transposase-like protein